MSRMVEYSILLLTYLSKQKPAEKMSAREISIKYNMPLPTVSKILKILARDGIVESTQGSKGGYTLVKDTADITLKMLIQTLDGKSSIVTCLNDDEGCIQRADCPAKDSMVFIDSEINKIFESITLKELVLKTADNSE
jgi:Rrf2 family protein